MVRLIITRLSTSIVSLIILITLVFFMVHATPGGPAYSILGVKATAKAIAAMNLKLGLAVPLPQQYAVWWWHLLQGRLGYSYQVNQPVALLIRVYMLNTLALYLSAIVLGTILSIIVGLIQGVYYDRLPGRIIGGLQLIFYSLPSFFVGTILILIFAVQFRWFPTGGISNLRIENPGIGVYIAHLTLPVLTVAIVSIAGLSRYFGQTVREELTKEYVRTAAAKGVAFPRILFGHVLRNALRPLVTILGLSFPYIFAGSIVVESVFSYPGLGWLLWQSALGQDYPVISAIVLLIGVLTILGNLLADIVNGLLDPRERFD
jgi:peptide/nickel transport system permease protein